jgi:hypothetical protein
MIKKINKNDNNNITFGMINSTYYFETHGVLVK